MSEIHSEQRASLAQACPEMAQQWHPTRNGDLSPSEVTRKSHRKIWWICDQGHEWEAEPASRRDTTCSVCSGRRVLKGVNDLATLLPEVASEWHPTKNGSLLPEDVRPGSSRKIWWQCSLGHEWATTPQSRKTSGCPVCSGKQVVAGFNDLSTTHPDVAAQWHPTKNGALTPAQLRPGSNHVAWWVCDLGHEWQASLSNRTSRASGCPQCGRLQASASRIAPKPGQSLSDSSPRLAAEWHPTKNGVLTPASVKSSYGKKVWWACDRGHEWQSTIGARINGKNCPVCAGKQILAGYNDLATLNPDLAAEWHPVKNGTLLPSQVGLRAAKKVWWRCKSGHEWASTVRNRHKGNGCPFCSGRKVLAGYNDLATTHPEIASQWHPTRNGDLTPQGVTSGSERSIWWQCDKGHEWMAFPYNRAGNGSGCPECVANLYVSRGETEVFDFVSSLLPGVEVRQSDRTAIRGSRGTGYGNGELDIYIPSINFAVEFNGLYWHSEAAGKDEGYHAAKHQVCLDKGIQLYQVWEDDWRDRRDIVMRGLAHRLGVLQQMKSLCQDMPDYWFERIGARQTRIMRVDFKTAAGFLDAHHIQGRAAGSHYFGLVDKEERVRAILVIKRASSHAGVYYIERYASAGIVAGGFTRLLSFAERAIPDVTRWVTFADRAVSDGGLYENTGFHVDKVLEPDYTYFVNGRREHKFNYRLARFKSDPGLIWQEGLSERELAARNGLVRIWDSGKTRYIKDVR